MSTNLGHGLQEKSKFLHISKNLHFPQVLKSVLRNPFQYRNVVIYLKRSCSFWLIFFRIRGAALTSPKIFIFELGPNGTTFMGVYCLLDSIYKKVLNKYLIFFFFYIFFYFFIIFFLFLLFLFFFIWGGRYIFSTPSILYHCLVFNIISISGLQYYTYF